MKYNILKYAIISVFVIALALGVGSNSIKNNDVITGKNLRVKVYLNGPEDIAFLVNNGVFAEDYFGNIKTGIELEITDTEFEKLKTFNYRYEILIADLDEYHNSKPPMTASEKKLGDEIMNSDGIRSYTLGTMGGYHKYTEIISVLDTMKLLYPNLITSKQSIGSSHESRTLYAVKISDNPDVDESATEVGVYFDGIHHAREPMSMEVLLYYMWWLLDNYSTNPEAQYLVNNREIFIVPIVNPDGYVYNQTTNPNGGGSWRKNRRNNGGSYGVDPNRNYSYGWGIGSGSSNNPSSDTYRGPYAFSEPECVSVRDFVLLKKPKIGISLHSAAGYHLNPLSYNDSVLAYQTYSDYSSEFGPTNNFLYGNVIQMLGYYSAGTTRDYLHSQGCYSWTSEMEGSSFWPSSSLIIPQCSRFMPTLKLVTWFGGGYAKLQNFKVGGKGWASKNDTLNLIVSVRNKSLNQASKNVVVELSSNYSGLTSIVNTASYDSISAKQTKANTINPFKFKIPGTANIADNMQFIATVKQEGVVASKDTFYVTVGKTDSLFFDDAENGKGNWTTTSNKLLWDTTYVSSWSGSHSFADSRYGNSQNSTQSYFNLTPTINLSGKINPRVEFAIKYATEVNYDYCRLQISTNSGSTWTSLPGRYTKIFSSQPSYIEVRYWVYEQINLSAYIGQNVKFRFYYYTDSGTPGDGVYIDDFRIVDYKDAATGITQTGNEVPVEFGLSQNYPNPFNPTTTIGFSIPKAGITKISVYDILGKEVNILVNDNLQPGYYNVNFDAGKLTSGVYFYKMTSGNFSEVKRMVLVK